MISIVITAYNVSNTINKSILSALNQTYNDIEVIVVNDKSTDNTLNIVKSISDDRLHIINNVKNVGAGLSRRIGIKEAKGEYVLLLDGDDYLSENYIYDLYTNNTEFDIISGGMTCVDRQGNIQYTTTKSLGEYQDDDKFKNEMNNTTSCFLNDKLVRRKLYDIVEYCDRRFIEDTPVLMKLLYYANKTKYVSNNGYFYLKNENSLTNTADKFKYFIFSMLFHVDMVEFFKDKDSKLMKSIYTLERFKKILLDTMSLNNIKVENLKEYKKEWNYIVDYFNK